MTLLLSKTPSSDIKNYVLPMMYSALESDTPKIQVGFEHFHFFIEAEYLKKYFIVNYLILYCIICMFYI